MELKDVFGEIESDGANLVHERLLEWALTPPLWHAEAVGGRPHHQALQARGTDLDLIRELPSGPAACEPHQRPHTCQHPTTGHTALEDFSCSSRGVHTCRKGFSRGSRTCGRRDRRSADLERLTRR